MNYSIKCIFVNYLINYVITTIQNGKEKTKCLNLNLKIEIDFSLLFFSVSALIVL